MTGPAPQVAFDVVARNLADRVLAEVRTSLVTVGNAAQEAAARGGRGVQGFEGMLVRWGVSARDAGRSSKLLEVGFRGLALEATGASGPIGALARSVFQLGGGQAALALTAILGAGAVAMKVFGGDTKQAKEELEKLNNEIDRLLARPDQDKLATLSGIGAQRAALPQDETSWRDIFVGLTAGPSGLEAARIARGAATRARAAALGLAERRQLEEISPTFRFGRQTLGEIGGFRADVSGIKPPDLSFEARLFLQKQQEEFQKEIREALKAGFGTTGKIGEAALEGVMGDIDFRHQLELEEIGLRQKMTTEAQRTVRTMNFLSSSIMLLGSVAGKSGTDVGNFFIGAGGLLGSTSSPHAQAIGAGLGIFGALINLFSPSKPMPVHDEQLANALVGVTLGPQQVTIIVQHTKDLEQTIADARRASRRDAIDRFPPGSFPSDTER